MVSSRRIIFVLCSVAVSAAGCKSGELRFCDDTDQVTMPEVSDADRVAYIKFDEAIELDTEDRQNRYSDITVHFDDFSNFDEGLTPVVPFGATCVGTLGKPVPEGELVRLKVERVTLSSTTMGDVLLEPDTDDGFAPLSLEKMFPPKGTETIQIDVVAADGDDSFPSFAETIDVPRSIEDVHPEMQGDGTLEIDWAPSDSTYFEITLRTLLSGGGSGQDNRLRCYFLADDGCFIVPAEAMDWLRSGGDTEFSLLVERHWLKISNVGENAVSQIDALRSIKFNIDI